MLIHSAKMETLVFIHDTHLPQKSSTTSKANRGPEGLQSRPMKLMLGVISVLTLLVVGMMGLCIWMYLYPFTEKLNLTSPTTPTTTPTTTTATTAAATATTAATTTQCQGFNNNNFTESSKKKIFKAPENGTYLIYGKVQKQHEPTDKYCQDAIKLSWNKTTTPDKMTEFKTSLVAETMVIDVQLEKDAEVFLELNCSPSTDNTITTLFIFCKSGCGKPFGHIQYASIQKDSSTTSRAGPGNLVRVHGIMNALKYQDILNQNLVASARKLKMVRHWVFQQDNDPKHMAKSTQKWFTTHRIKLLPWPSQSPDLNPIENLWGSSSVGMISMGPKEFNSSVDIQSENRKSCGLFVNVGTLRVSWSWTTLIPLSVATGLIRPATFVILFVWFCRLGVHLDERLDWSVNTDIVYKKAQSRLYFLRRLGSFRICQKLLLMFYQSVVASVLFYAVVCWGGSISKRDAGRLDRLVRKAGSVLGLELESLTPLAERRALNKLLNIMDNVHHPLHTTIIRQRS
ncbi:hypothetical protein NFI96_005753 [Prochilodus magdalenae]|nr:hypothetical protein NFI96_005753 [Prochilodus magdalenae]